MEMSDFDLLHQQQSSGGGDISFFSKRNAAVGGTPDVAMDVGCHQFDPVLFGPTSYRPDYTNQLENFPTLGAKPITPGRILVNDVHHHGPATARVKRSLVGPQKGKGFETIVPRESARDQKIKQVL